MNSRIETDPALQHSYIPELFIQKQKLYRVDRRSTCIYSARSEQTEKRVVMQSQSIMIMIAHHDSPGSLHSGKGGHKLTVPGQPSLALGKCNQIQHAIAADAIHSSSGHDRQRTRRIDSNMLLLSPDSPCGTTTWTTHSSQQTSHLHYTTDGLAPRRPPDGPIGVGHQPTHISGSQNDRTTH